eukprot:CAMPEP_0184867570 /NCGR_PEP_ID=MMETSP0580-20130426/27059_1 /TAXON_ID=1118495 /ORGANISM="Dactyliosolen fragilissimus" /LENGTH=87 /DNA_ID=CAMNT_0027367931 /DNA_START=953 /DNA_END=1217 /DNA_ORIENTATION=-
MKKETGDEVMPEDPLFEEHTELGQSKPSEDYPYEDDNNGKEHVMGGIDNVPDLDRYVGAEVILPKDGVKMQASKVIGRVTNKSRMPI